jgi:hypothetical protein
VSDRCETDPVADDSLFLRVECYAGDRADTEPRRLFIGGREVSVTEVIDRWLDPRHRYFKLRGDDSGVYLVRQDTLSNEWELTLFDSGHRAETRLSST